LVQIANIFVHHKEERIKLRKEKKANKKWQKFIELMSGLEKGSNPGKKNQRERRRGL
jgi:hypothetical protein